MKKTLYILILLSLGFLCADNNCGLKNGKYKVVYNEEFSDYPKLEFEVNGQTLTKIYPGSNKNFTIESIGENAFRLNSLEKHPDTLTDFQKTLTSNGQSYYEITGCNKDTIEFVVRLNLHVISHSGKFVRTD